MHVCVCVGVCMSLGGRESETREAYCKRAVGVCLHLKDYTSMLPPQQEQ